MEDPDSNPDLSDPKLDVFLLFASLTEKTMVVRQVTYCVAQCFGVQNMSFSLKKFFSCVVEVKRTICCGSYSCYETYRCD